MSNRRFGFECELTSGARHVIRELYNRGLAKMDYLHDYHCRDAECTAYDVEVDNYPHGGPPPLFHGQHDCTVNGEIITNILTLGKPKADQAFAELSDVLRSVRAGIGESAGMHVHVDKTDLTTEGITRVQRIFLRYQDDIAELAAGRFGEVRGYNSRFSEYVWPRRLDTPVSYFTRGTWLAQQSQTFEFRVWNSTRVEWRMRMAVGVSVAIVNAAKDGVNVRQNDARPFEEVLFDYLDDDAWAGLIRQRSFKDAA